MFITLILFTSNANASKKNEYISIFNAIKSINSEWNNPVFSNLDNKQVAINFSQLSESEKIKLHLAQVENILRKNIPSDLSDEQLSNRFRNLNILHKYSQNGTFPRNLTHKNRIPVFVDDRNIPCAVGYLMLKSGYNDFVSTTRTNSNNIYVKEIQSYMFEQFKSESGFTLDELALIQPGYEEYIVFDRLISKVNQIDYSIADDKNQNIYFFGELKGIEQDNIRNIAKFDGVNWFAVPNEIEGKFTSALVIGNNLFVAGNLKYGENKEPVSLLQLSDKGWKVLPIQGEIRTLKGIGNKLLIGGDFYQIADTGSKYFAIYNFDLNQFENTYAKFNGAINAISVNYGNIVVGGEFTLNNGIQQTYISELINNKWTGVSNEITTPVYALYSGIGGSYQSSVRDSNTLIIGCTGFVQNPIVIGLIYERSKNVIKDISETTIKYMKYPKDLTIKMKVTNFSNISFHGNSLVASIESDYEKQKGFLVGLNYSFSVLGNEILSDNEFPNVSSLVEMKNNFYISSSQIGLSKSNLEILSVDFENPYKDEITNISGNSNEFSFKFSEKAELYLSFKLYNLIGSEIYNYSEQSPNKDVLTVNKVNIQNGCYIANIVKDSKVYNLKVLVKN